MFRRAPFIVIEGLDRSGKSTQTGLLLARFEAAGLPAKLIKFPGKHSDSPKRSSTLMVLMPDRTTSIGQMINSYLQSESELDDRAIHLLFSANRWELAYVHNQ